MKGKKLLSSLAICSVLALGVAPLLAQQGGPSDADRMKTILHQMTLMGGGETWLGLEVADVTQSKVQELKLPGDYGAIVTHVVQNSPAAKAGVKTNDVILEFGGMKVWSAAQLGRWVNETPAGRKVSLRISRDGRKITLEPTVEKHAEGFAMNMRSFKIPPIHIPRNYSFQIGPFGMRGRLGIEAQDLTPQLASYFGVKQGKGVLVAEVEAGSPAANAGVKAGDCIVSVDSTEVTSISDLRRELAQKQQGSDHSVTLAIVRNGHEEQFHVRLQSNWTPNPQQEAENYARGLETQVQQIEKQLPRLERREKQLESCLVALENHLFSANWEPHENSPMTRGPHGVWVATGQGCPWDGARNGG